MRFVSVVSGQLLGRIRTVIAFIRIRSSNVVLRQRIHLLHVIRMEIMVMVNMTYGRFQIAIIVLAFMVGYIKAQHILRIFVLYDGPKNV
jgi:hypothetical protein